MKNLIMLATLVCMLVALGPAAQADTLFEEHFVDSLGPANPGWGRTAQEVNWPAPNDSDWVFGLALSEYDGGSRTRWQEQGGGTYSYNLSNLYDDGVPTPDGDGWHFSGIHDGAGQIQYGIVYGSATQQLNIERNKIYSGRHAIVQSNTANAAYYGIARNITTFIFFTAFIFFIIRLRKKKIIILY